MEKKTLNAFDIFSAKAYSQIDTQLVHGSKIHEAGDSPNGENKELR